MNEALGTKLFRIFWVRIDAATSLSLATDAVNLTEFVKCSYCSGWFVRMAAESDQNGPISHDSGDLIGGEVDNRNQNTPKTQCL